MNKSELIEAIAKATKLSKKDAGNCLKATLETITKSLKKNNPVQLVGFGTFKVTARKARTGRNPLTKEPMKIKACKVPAFRAGKTLKNAVNKRKK